MKIRIRGAKVRLRLRRLRTDQGVAGEGGRGISVDRRLWPRRKADALIHEMLHVAQPDLSEEAVDEIAADLAAALCRVFRLKPRRRLK